MSSRCGRNRTLTEPVSPTQNASSPSPWQAGPPWPASAMSSAWSTGNGDLRGLFSPLAITVGPASGRVPVVMTVTPAVAVVPDEGPAVVVSSVTRLGGSAGALSPTSNPPATAIAAAVRPNLLRMLTSPGLSPSLALRSVYARTRATTKRDTRHGSAARFLSRPATVAKGACPQMSHRERVRLARVLALRPVAQPAAGDPGQPAAAAARRPRSAGCASRRPSRRVSAFSSSTSMSCSRARWVASESLSHHRESATSVVRVLGLLPRRRARRRPTGRPAAPAAQRRPGGLTVVGVHRVGVARGPVHPDRGDEQQRVDLGLRDHRVGHRVGHPAGDAGLRRAPHEPARAPRRGCRPC